MDEHDDRASDCEETVADILADLIREEAPVDRFTCALCFKALTHPRSLPECKHILCRECFETIHTTTEPDIDKRQTTKEMETDDASQNSSKGSDSGDDDEEVEAQRGDDEDYAIMPPVTEIPDVGDLFGMIGAIDPILQREEMTDPFIQRNADPDDYMRAMADGFPFAFSSQQSMSSQGSVGDILLSQTQDAGSSGVVTGRLSTHQATTGDEAGVLKKAAQRVICPVCQAVTLIQSSDIGDAPNVFAGMVGSDFDIDINMDLNEDSKDNQPILSQTHGLAQCSSGDCENEAGFYCETKCGYLCGVCEK